MEPARVVAKMRMAFERMGLVSELLPPGSVSWQLREASNWLAERACLTVLEPELEELESLAQLAEFQPVWFATLVCPLKPRPAVS